MIFSENRCPLFGIMLNRAVWRRMTDEMGSCFELPVFSPVIARLYAMGPRQFLPRSILSAPT
jgi:hypothetical protein